MLGIDNSFLRNRRLMGFGRCGIVPLWQALVCRAFISPNKTKTCTTTLDFALSLVTVFHHGGWYFTEYARAGILSLTCFDLSQKVCSQSIGSLWFLGF